MIEIQYYQGTISGESIKAIRLNSGMSQPEFAKYLRKKTGKPTTSVMVTRYENFGAKDGKYLYPPLIVEDAVLELANATERKLIRKVMSEYQKLGLFEAEGETAAELVRHIRASLCDIQRGLVDENEEVSSDVNEIVQQIDALLKEEAELNAESIEIDEQLIRINDSDRLSV